MAKISASSIEIDLNIRIKTSSRFENAGRHATTKTGRRPSKMAPAPYQGRCLFENRAAGGVVVLQRTFFMARFFHLNQHQRPENLIFVNSSPSAATSRRLSAAVAVVNSPPSPPHIFSTQVGAVGALGRGGHLKSGSARRYKQIDKRGA